MGRLAGRGYKNVPTSSLWKLKSCFPLNTFFFGGAAMFLHSLLTLSHQQRRVIQRKALGALY